MTEQPFWSDLTARVGSLLPLPTRTSHPSRPLPQGVATWFRPLHSANEHYHSQHAITELLRAVIDNTTQESETTPPTAGPTPKRFKSNSQHKAPPERATRIRLYPTAKQRAILNEWFGTARWTYNQCIDAVENKKVKLNKEELRKYCVYQVAPNVIAHPWVCNTPQAIRNEALCDALKAYKTAFALKKKQKQKHFAMKFRSLKAPSQSIVIQHRDWKDTTKIFLAAAFAKRGAETTLNASESLPASIDYDCRLQRTRLGHFYFCLLHPKAPRPVQPPPDPARPPRILAIDPGVRTFLTGYDPWQGSYVEWGKGDMKRIERLGGHLDNLISRTAKEPDVRRRYRMRRAQMRMRLRIRNLVDEFHKKLVRWLVDTYELVLLPEYNSSDMVDTNSRNISSRSVRAMMTWAPYRFKQRLLMKAKLEGGACHVAIVREHHTTITCGECGHLHREVGGNKVFECPRCLSVLPRDWNAARNIFLRYITTSTWGTSLPGLGLAPRLAVQ